jgi:hypothetical protein
MSVDIGTLAGKIEFEDKISSTMDIVLTKIDKLEASFGGLNTSVKTTAEGFLIAELAMKAVDKVLEIGIDLIRDFTTEGATIADVEDNFNRLAAGANRAGETMLGILREGTHSTITDFELMKTVNDQFSAGIHLTDEQMRTLAQGGFALAQAKGIAVQDAFEKLNQAMLTGNTRSIRFLTGQIDLTKAEDDYAKKLGTTSDRLTPLEKQESAREAILLKVAEATTRLGEQTDGVDEIIAQVSTSWHNFYEELIKNVAASPNVVAAFTTVRDAIYSALGGDTETILANFQSGVNAVADKVTEYAPLIIDWFVRVKNTAVAFYGGAVEAWDKYGPTIVNGFSTILDWIVKVYNWVVTSWQALPDWLKTVAERTAITSVGLYLLGAGASSASSMISNLIGYAGNLTTTFSGLPAAISNIVGGLTQMGVWIKVLDFSSIADAGASFKLLGGAILGTIGPLGIATAYAAALYGAYELGKWQPISDFFMDLGLRLQGFSEAERAAMIEADKQTQAMLAQTEAHKSEQEALDLLDKLMTRVRDSMKDVTESFKNQGQEVAATTNTTRAYLDAWDNLHRLGKTWKDTLDTINVSIKDSVMHYAALGASAEDLIQAFPKLTKAQAAAAAESVKASQSVRQVTLETFEIIAKSHGDNINDWIKGEREKLAATLQSLQLQGELTTDMLNAEMAKFDATVDAEIRKREEQSQFTKTFYEHEVDMARAALDLMLLNTGAYTDAEIREARRALEEKLRMLEHWRAYADQAYTDHTQVVNDEAEKQKKSIEQIGDTWRNRVGGAVQEVTDKIRTLSGELITAAERAKRMAMGGTFALAPLFPGSDRGERDTSGEWTVSKMQAEVRRIEQGYALHPGRRSGGVGDTGINPRDARGWVDMLNEQQLYEQLKQALHAAGVPGYRTGGFGDFGDGTLAMLHGREAIIPLGSGGGMLAPNFYFTMEGLLMDSSPGGKAALQRVVIDALTSVMRGQLQFSA